MSHELCSKVGCGWVCERAGRGGLLLWAAAGIGAAYGLTKLAVLVGKGPMILTAAAAVVTVSVCVVNAIRTSVASTRYGAAVAEILSNPDEYAEQVAEPDLVADDVEDAECADCGGPITGWGDVAPLGMSVCLDCDTERCAVEAERQEQEAQERQEQEQELDVRELFARGGVS
jgi:hypothetical protein